MSFGVPGRYLDHMRSRFAITYSSWVRLLQSIFRPSSARTSPSAYRRSRCISSGIWLSMKVIMTRRSPELTVTRLASGLPVGSDLEYADEVTLGKAFAGRRSL